MFLIYTVKNNVTVTHDHLLIDRQLTMTTYTECYIITNDISL
jgi:hypothetical protein